MPRAPSASKAGEGAGHVPTMPLFDPLASGADMLQLLSASRGANPQSESLSSKQEEKEMGVKEPKRTGHALYTYDQPRCSP
eukprot:scaffold1090_cov265-Pinguiococcus_pyrenoidosus.AAC.22